LKLILKTNYIQNNQRKGGDRMTTESLYKKVLVLSMQEGVDEKGKPITKKYSYSNILMNTAPQNLFDAAQAISDLSNGSSLEFAAVDTKALLPE
jgi:hypothetical protein